MHNTWRVLSPFVRGIKIFMSPLVNGFGDLYLKCQPSVRRQISISIFYNKKNVKIWSNLFNSDKFNVFLFLGSSFAPKCY